MGAPHSPRSHPSEGPAAALLDPSFPCKTRRLLRTRPMPAKSTNYPLSVNGFAKLLLQVQENLPSGTESARISGIGLPQFPEPTKARANQQLVINGDKLLTPFSSPLSRRFATICHI